MAEETSGVNTGQSDAANIKPSPRQTPQPAQPESAGVSQVTDEQWKFMSDVVIAIYEYREQEYVFLTLLGNCDFRLGLLTSNNSGYDPSRLFHRSVNKRNVPDYYAVIKEPMALSILKQKIKNRSYTHFADFVRDCALVSNTTTAQQLMIF